MCVMTKSPIKINSCVKMHMALRQSYFFLSTSSTGLMWLWQNSKKIWDGATYEMWLKKTLGDVTVHNKSYCKRIYNCILKALPVNKYWMALPMRKSDCNLGKRKGEGHFAPIIFFIPSSHSTQFLLLFLLHHHSSSASFTFWHKLFPLAWNASPLPVQLTTELNIKRLVYKRC